MAKQALPIGWKYPKSRDVFASVTDKSHNGRLQLLSATQDRGIVPRTAMDIDIKYNENALPTYKRVVSGNFVIHLRSFQGGLAYSDIEGIISPAYVILEPKVRIEDGYYKYLFQSTDYIKRLNVAVYGIRDGKQISYESFGMINIPLPPLAEQRAISEILTTADRLIAVKERLIAAKRKQKRWLMQNLLTGKVRLPGHSEGWESVRLGDYLVEHNEITTTNNQYPVLTSSRRGIFLQTDYYNKDIASEDNTGYNVVPFGYFTYRHMSDDEIFRFNINTLVPRGIVSTLYPVFTTKNIDEKFLLELLNEGTEFRRYSRLQKQGGSRTYMYFSKLSLLRLTIPPLPEQQAIAAVLTAADREIELLARELEQQRQVKKYLMQQLLTGRIRTKEATV